jgi:hypothetical protein
LSVHVLEDLVHIGGSVHGSIDDGEGISHQVGPAQTIENGLIERMDPERLVNEPMKVIGELLEGTAPVRVHERGHGRAVGYLDRRPLLVALAGGRHDRHQIPEGVSQLQGLLHPHGHLLAAPGREHQSEEGRQV